MKIIKLASVDSTNVFLKKMVNSGEGLSNFLTVWTLNQTQGVGQYGAKWMAEPYKNLTFSVLYIHENFDLERYFVLNMLTSIAIVTTLKSLGVPNLHIKWPNDILSNKYKIGGVLIENIIRGGKIEKSIIGIGLNVNQTNFEGLPKASSLKNETGKSFDIEEIINKIVVNLQQTFSQIDFSFQELYPAYRSHLFRLNEVSAFRPQQGSDFSGIIRRVLPSGELVVETEEGEKHFSLKEVQLLY
ncbi:biotin--[acetyl-CoA-carboxylase] ligase [Capnocytophaga canis]|uniref:biotin--[acetyl-CoA-carboxylase] ligase n=1 Tax=Capnocytophaga canis TaxID=1848903 RepID=UPI0037D5F577